MGSSNGSKMEIEAWQSLVHVCQRWRNLIFGSPRRLNLQLYCSPETPTRDTLDVWPALPLLIYAEGDRASSSGMGNIIAAFRQNNRVRQVSLEKLAGWQWEEILAAMQVPFPELTGIKINLEFRPFRLSRSEDEIDETTPVIPDSFLDGSAPRLQYFELSCIPFPGLPKLLLSATRLVQLRLTDIPHSGYISPEAMIALFPVLSSLESLFLSFNSPQSRTDLESRSLPPPKRSILPVLNVFRFHGVTEYLEELVTHIDTPRLGTMSITFHDQIDFHCPRLTEFINYTPTLRARDYAQVIITDWLISVDLKYHPSCASTRACVTSTNLTS